MRPPRIAGFSYTGFYRYFLTFTTHGRLTLFTDGTVVSSVLEQFRQSAEQHGFELLAYCFMPDHLHLLCEALRADSRLVVFVRQAKQRSGYAFARRGIGPLWQESFHDRALRDEDHTLAVVRYIVMNPVRAGLTKAVGEYLSCGSDRYSLDEILACAELWTRSW